MPHPLLGLFAAAAAGDHPSPDGAVTFLPPFDDGREAVVAFTGHAVIASRLGPDDLADLGPDGFGGALAPAVLLRLAAGGTIGVNDVTLVSHGTGRALGQPPGMAPTRRWDDHPRVAHALRLRHSVEVHGDDRGFITLGRGLAGRREISIEVVEPQRGTGVAQLLLDHARGLVEHGTPLFAGVSPGNARSLRAFLGAGFVPIASEVIVSPHEPAGPFR